MLYTNIQKFNDGIRLYGQTPLDDRIVLSTVDDLYIATGSATSHELYGRAYNGLVVSAADTGELYVCLNAEPYTPGMVTTVNRSNLHTYWLQVGKELYDYVHGPVDSSIDRLDGSVNILSAYDRAENLVEGQNGAIDVTYEYIAEREGNKYTISAKVDDDTIRIISDQITGGKYKLTKLSESQLPQGIFSSYRLSYQGPGETSYSDLTAT